MEFDTVGNLVHRTLSFVKGPCSCKEYHWNLIFYEQVSDTGNLISTEKLLSKR